MEGRYEQGKKRQERGGRGEGRDEGGSRHTSVSVTSSGSLSDMIGRVLAATS